MAGVMIMKFNEQSFDSGLSFCRIISTLGVILIHTASVAITNFSGTDYSQINLLYGLKLSSFWSVPIFLMITGYLLSQKDEFSIQDTKKCFARLFFVFILFVFPMTLLKNLLSCNTNILKLCLYSLFDIFTNNSFKHFWYLYLLIAIYAFAPMFHLFMCKCTNKQLRIALGYLFLVAFIFPQIEIFTNTHIASFFLITYYAFYILFSKYIYEKINSYLVIILFWFFIGLCFTLNIYASDFALVIFNGYNKPIIALMATLVFITCMKAPKIHSKLIWTLDRCSFGVYIIHPLFIHALIKMIGKSCFSNYINVIFITILVAVLSYIFTAFLRSVLFFRKII